MPRYTAKFLDDLARLLSHGYRPISQLIADLNDAEKRTELTHALQNLRDVSTSLSRTKQKSRSNIPIQPSIGLPIKWSVDPEKYDLLSNLSKLLLEVQTFRERRLLVEIAESLQVRVGSRDSRIRIIQRIVNTAGDLPVDRIRQVVDNVRMMESGTGESFKELARFITRGPNR